MFKNATLPAEVKFKRLLKSIDSRGGDPSKSRERKGKDMESIVEMRLIEKN
jgi:hypothetical protein